MLKVRWSAAIDAAARAVQVTAITIAAKARLARYASHRWATPVALGLAALVYLSPKGWLWG